MNLNKLRRSSILVAGLVCGLFVASANLPAANLSADPLLAGFRNPSSWAKPTLFWMMGETTTTKEGITADLEAYQQMGFGGATWFEQLFLHRTDPVKAFTPEYFELVRHAATESKRLGLVFEFNVSSGYCTGGRWITPELAMQRLISSTVTVKGPQRYVASLPRPGEVQLNHYRDIAVLAFPAPTGTTETARPKISSSPPLPNLESLLDGDLSTGVQVVIARTNFPIQIVLEYPRSVTRRSLRLVMHPAESSWEHTGNNEPFVPPGVLEVSDDGLTYRTVADLPTPIWNWRSYSDRRTVSFPAVSGRFFRLNFNRWEGWEQRDIPSIYPSGERLISEIELTGAARVDRWEEKAGYAAEYPALDRTPEFAPAECLDVKAMRDLTPLMDGDGRLTWEVPPGEWTIFRLGHTAVNFPTLHGRPEVSGLECDKLSAEAAEFHFEHYAKVIQEQCRAAGGRLDGFHLDSCEYGAQNWTPRFREEFHARRGYDLTPYLPAMQGFVVGDRDRTDRVLFDVRRTIADLMADNQFGKLRELCEKNGLRFTAQAPGATMGVYANMIQCKGRCDIPAGEFWINGRKQVDFYDIRDTASAAHVYGRPIAAAEAFTGSRWQAYPDMLLPYANEAFANGINRLVLMGGQHQPWSDQIACSGGQRIRPFQRYNTWWPMSRSWWEYLSRSCQLLQQGRFVADVCYSTGEDIPARLLTYRLSPPLPAGYDYDACPPEVIIRDMQVRDGRIVLPDGMSYSVLALPDTERMTLSLLRKVRELVRAGATVSGPKPLGSPSLADADAEVRRLAQEVWGGLNGTTVTESRFGRGRVVWGQSLPQIFGGLKLPPDCVFEETSAQSDVHWIHRRTDDADIYYIGNLRPTAETFRAVFRTTGKQPELWDAATGEVRDLPEFAEREGRTSVALRLEAGEGCFVVFRKPVRPPESIAGNGGAKKPSGNFPLLTGLGELAGSWSVSFDPKHGGPTAPVVFAQLEDWAKRSEDGIRFYSGEATYRKELALPTECLAAKAAGDRLYLDLGKVAVVASVKLNGHDLGVAWKAPYRVDITDAVRADRNQLEITVANLWLNRMIGDAGLPEDKRVVRVSYNPHAPDQPLVTSGLLGPVTLQAGASGIALKP